MRKIFRPSELHSFLKEHKTHARKRLSQNFLIDGNIIQKIVAMAGIAKGDPVLEIGPGPGALTEAMLEKGARVTAVELDPTFAEKLHRLQTPDHRLQVYPQDILEFPFEDFFKTEKYKVVGNLPYHITTPILTRLLPMHRWVESLTIMVQKEYADRMTAKIRTPEYSSFTLFFQFYAKAVKRFEVSPNSFFPKPKVHSSVLLCQLHPPPLQQSEEFFRLTRTAFGKRRKMLRASLKEIYAVEKIEQTLEQLGRSKTARPEELSLSDFISFYEKVSS